MLYKSLSQQCQHVTSYMSIFSVPQILLSSKIFIVTTEFWNMLELVACVQDNYLFPWWVVSIFIGPTQLINHQNLTEYSIEIKHNLITYSTVNKNLCCFKVNQKRSYKSHKLLCRHSGKCEANGETPVLRYCVIKGCEKVLLRSKYMNE